MTQDVLGGLLAMKLYCNRRLGGLDCIAGHQGVLQYRAAARLKKKMYCNIEVCGGKIVLQYGGLEGLEGLFFFIAIHMVYCG